MKKNPKALNLEILEIIDKPVTLGFKVNPEVKLKLAKNAAESGLSLSMYVKKILTDKQDWAKNEINSLITQNKKLNEKINIYENEKLKSIFSKYKGHHIKYRDNSGTTKEIIVNELVDVHKILINSFKSI